MQNHQHKFLDAVIEAGILRFGEFSLKSGRVSPYFFDAGLFNTGSRLALLAESYAAAISAAGIEFDVLFGPAYKGIPIAATTAQALALQHGIDKPYCFNRKEVKEHGEGGSLVGAPMKGKVLIIDDVITAGTAIRESAAIISNAGAKLTAIAVALDRQERGSDESHNTSAIQEIEQEYRAKVISIITLADIIEHLSQHQDPGLAQHLSKVQAYRDRYGSS